MNFKIVKTNRNNDVLIPSELIRNEEVLINGIDDYCNFEKLNPIFIDKNIAIFQDHLLIAFYEDELL
jgi:hypothetical protein